MSAPANDNFANAIDLTSASAPVAGTTVGATVESGEPEVPIYNAQNHYPNSSNTNPTQAAQNSVWYKFTVNSGYFPAPQAAPGYTNPSPQQGMMFFETVSPMGGTPTTFPSDVEVFTGSAVNGLVRIALWVDYHAGRFNGQDAKAYVQFSISVGTTFYIRVSSRDGATGTFSLNWGQVNQGQGVLNVLAGCGTGLSSDGLCYGTVQMTDVSSANTVTFPSSVAAGIYEVRYLRGALIFGTAADGWTVAYGSAATTIKVNWPESNAPFPQLGRYYTASAAETANQCQKVTFLTCGGTVSMDFVDGFYADNIIPSNVSPPTFALVNITNWATIQAAPAFSSFSGSAGSWSCGFGIQNTSGATLSVTVALLNTGGVTGASGPQTITLPPGNSTISPFTFSAPITSSFCTATLQISVCGSVVTSLAYPLYPIITVTDGGGGTGGSCGTPDYTKGFSVTLSSPTTGLSPFTPVGFTVTSSAVSLIDHDGGTCADISSYSVNYSSAGPNYFSVYTHLPSVATVNTFMVAITCGSLSYPGFTSTVTIPTH